MIPPLSDQKIIACCVAVFLLPVASWADDITLADGKTVFHNAKIISRDAASVNIKHSTGIARVMIPDLPPELRAQFNYDSDAVNQEEAQAQQLRDVTNAAAAARTAADDAYRKALAAWNRSAVALSGKILSISRDGVILQGTGFGVGDKDTVFVKHIGEGFADDEYISVTAVPAGTHSYSSASGAARTIPAFDAERPMKPQTDGTSK